VSPHGLLKTDKLLVDHGEAMPMPELPRLLAGDRPGSSTRTVRAVHADSTLDLAGQPRDFSQGLTPQTCVPPPFGRIGFRHERNP
jgi:hypothetical protein